MRLETPISKDIVKKLKVGDIVYLNGTIYTGRDEAHITIIEEYIKKNKKNKNNNISGKTINDIVKKLKNGVIYHAGPIMKKENNKWKCVAIGPTTSARMNDIEAEFIKITNISAIVGKGGMKTELLKTFEKYGVVYLAAPGGCAALLASSIVDVKDVYYPELGMPEAIWELEVKDFGPLMVAMDSNGNSIYKKVNNEVLKNLNTLKSKISNNCE
ncbi:FumA C-terminus/TtdB family hydratase beta subunit [Methanothermococcus okinawensis]|uniref:Hydro-lyase, Fe-S type, tartrate/fumarate subfamily, beta subunit n=1 Tax=Methanothermococcus okinawensis (strain DSM 14208 / JCM 11175 / IH1) TaxID=647113 RepID=F8ALB8_METOI|nr:FumA C-terminus/TtdB family hydratase beta subunit [Methanothermococcus okinawensis]AEH06506.1 hydro-lyase, Fe-S type, tartrate/fumarate subfamily, beta subunit [Methanothermococcus okinawensis IH1]